MTSSHPAAQRRLGAIVALLALCGAIGAGHAADAPAKPVKAPAKPAAKKRLATPLLPVATPEQLAAAQLVFYGHYECEFNQAIDIESNVKNGGYVDVRHGKAIYLMKPVLSSTGAVRLEDVKGETLMVQIANKSMLMNVKAGRRLVDDCVSPKQRELIEAATKARAAEAAASAAGAADSGPAVAAPAAPAASQ